MTVDYTNNMIQLYNIINKKKAEKSAKMITIYIETVRIEDPVHQNTIGSNYT